MTRTFVFFTAGAIALSIGCASSNPTAGSGDPSTNTSGAMVEVTAEGGIAALSSRQRVQHDDLHFVLVQRRICGTTCSPPMDSASGTLNAGAADSLFAIVLDQARRLEKDDYGTTRNGADMMTYTIVVTADGRTRTIRGDDGTMPEPARRILAAVRESISAARR